MAGLDRFRVAAGVFAVTFFGLTALAAGLPYFGLHVLEGTGMLGLALILETSIIAALCSGMLGESKQKESAEVGFAPKNLVDIIKSYLDGNDFHAVIKLGMALSRPLWVFGLYDQRLQIGEFLIEAASRLIPQDVGARVHAKIDDVGWTSVVLGNLQQGSESVSDGIREATEIGDRYMIAKGNRHLAAIALMRDKADEALQYLDKAASAANQIRDESLKEEMLGGISLARGDVYLDTKNIVKAELLFLEAKEGFEKRADKERLAKIFSRLGRVREMSGDYDRAYELYYQGLEFSKTNLVHRSDETARNQLGLARLALFKGKNKECEKWAREALAIGEQLRLKSVETEARALVKEST